MGMLLAILDTTRVCHLLKDSVRGKVKIQPNMAQQPLHWVSGVVVLDDANLHKVATFRNTICLHVGMGTITAQADRRAHVEWQIAALQSAARPWEVESKRP